MSDTKTPIWVTIAVNIDGETKTFEADAAAAGNPYDVAGGILSGLDNEAGRWINRSSIDYDRAHR